MQILEFLRQFRIGEYAIFDLSVSFLGIYLLSPFLSKLFRRLGIDVPKLNWLYFTLPIGIIFHLLFQTITPMTRNLFDVNGHYFLKILMLVLIILGMRKIKIHIKKIA